MSVCVYIHASLVFNWSRYCVIYGERAIRAQFPFCAFLFVASLDPKRQQPGESRVAPPSGDASLETAAFFSVSFPLRIFSLYYLELIRRTPIAKELRRDAPSRTFLLSNALEAGHLLANAVQNAPSSKLTISRLQKFVTLLDS